MDVRLQPLTRAGATFVELAERHGVEVGAGAAKHDAGGTFPFEAFASMKESGFMTATVPDEFGGLGLTSIHDLAVGLSRLGAGDGSVAIAANMHLNFATVMGWLRKLSAERGDTELVESLGSLMAILGAGTIAMGNNTEAGTDLLHPLTEATKVDGGWQLNGRKAFGTLSPIADLFLVTARVVSPDGSFAACNAFVFRGSEGHEVMDNWDAMGMRATGSHDVLYTDCFVPDDLLFVGGQWGEDSEISLVVSSIGNYGLTSSFLGMAEVAYRQAVTMAKKRTKAPSGRPIAERSGIQHLVAEMEIDLATSRALVERTGRLLDEVFVARPALEATIDVLHEVHQQLQCTKFVVNRKAIEIVDRALTISGGSGYMQSSSLARLYRDVRAGPFMQPYSPSEVHEYVGKVALGLEPVVSC